MNWSHAIVYGFASIGGIMLFVVLFYLLFGWLADKAIQFEDWKRARRKRR
jgi:apolipoprotein N-acyltransferase